MRHRLFTLLLVAAVSGTIAGFVGAATAGKQRSPAARPGTTFTAGRCPVPAKYRAAFVAAAKKTGLPLAMLTAVATVESHFDHNARSTAGAHGLLQVMPSTAKSFSLNPDRPEENVLAGARYLKQMLDEFQSADLALAAYNAGPTAVIKAGGAPTAETLTYVQRVTKLWRSLTGCK